jgi:hypothetical protein
LTISLLGLGPNGHPSALTAIKKKQAHGDIWGLFPAADTALGSEISDKYSLISKLKAEKYTLYKHFKNKKERQKTDHLQKVPLRKTNQK